MFGGPEMNVSQTETEPAMNQGCDSDASEVQTGLALALGQPFGGHGVHIALPE